MPYIVRFLNRDGSLNYIGGVEYDTPEVAHQAAEANELGHRYEVCEVGDRVEKPEPRDFIVVARINDRRWGLITHELLAQACLTGPEAAQLIRERDTRRYAYKRVNF